MRPITAADLMNPHVLTVREDLTVQELASFLLRHQITGAPVEDGDGHLVGVVSVSDIAEASLADTPEGGESGEEYSAGALGTRLARPEAASGGAPAGAAVRGRAATAWSERWLGSASPRRPAGAAAGGPARRGTSKPEASDTPADRDLDLADEPTPLGAAPEGKDELTVRDIMTPAVVSVAEDATVSEVASKMLDGHVHRLVVTRHGQPLGIITTSDLLGLLIDER